MDKRVVYPARNHSDSASSSSLIDLLRKEYVSRGFSLVEIVLAIGIVSFALVAIMGLFPVAMKSAQESHRETRAAQIAMQIFNDLRSPPATNAMIATNGDIISAQLRVNLTNVSSNIISYSVDGVPIGMGTNANAIFLGEVVVTPNSPMSGLSRVQTTIETPAVSSNRSKYTFVTILDQR